MKNIHLHGKAFNDADFKGIIIGGQNQADTLRLVVPKVYGGELDLSSWSWALAYENEKGYCYGRERQTYLPAVCIQFDWL